MSIAHQLLESFFACAIQQDGAAFGALFAEDGVLAYPFASLRFVGPAAIADRAATTWAASPFVPELFELTELIESETGLTAEYTVSGTERETGKPASVGAIAVLEVVDDKIIAMRAYLVPIEPRVKEEPQRPVRTACQLGAFL